MGGKNSFIFLRGESAFSLIINKINYIKICLNEPSKQLLTHTINDTICWWEIERRDIITNIKQRAISIELRITKSSN